MRLGWGWVALATGYFQTFRLDYFSGRRVRTISRDNLTGIKGFFAPGAHGHFVPEHITVPDGSAPFPNIRRPGVPLYAKLQKRANLKACYFAAEKTFPSTKHLQSPGADVSQGKVNLKACIFTAKKIGLDGKPTSGFLHPPFQKPGGKKKGGP